MLVLPGCQQAEDGIFAAWNRPALDRIFITVDGTTYGPYTLGDL